MERRSLSLYFDFLFENMFPIKQMSKLHIVFWNSAIFSLLQSYLWIKGKRAYCMKRNVFYLLFKKYLQTDIFLKCFANVMFLILSTYKP